MHCVDAVRSGRVQGGCEARSLCIVLLLLGLVDGCYSFSSLATIRGQEQSAPLK